MKNIEVKKTPKMGRGVFATKNIKAEETIEICPVILIPCAVGEKHNPTQDYSFRWNPKFVAIALGYGSLYNHSYSPNAKVYEEKREKNMRIVAHTDIKKGDEIFINYAGEPDNQIDLWFKTSTGRKP